MPLQAHPVRLTLTSPSTDEFDGFKHRSYPGRPRVSPEVEALIACGQSTVVPAENRFGLGDTRYVGEELAAEEFFEFRQRAPLGVGEPDVAGPMRPQDPIFCDEIFA